MYLLQAGDADGVYNFILKEEEVLLMPKNGPYDTKTQLLAMEESVSNQQGY